MEVAPVGNKLPEGYSCLSVASRRFCVAEVSLGRHVSCKAASLQRYGETDWSDRNLTEFIGSGGEELE
jgi:hypothetical protein